MQLVIVGAHQKTASVEVRECLSFSAAQLQTPLQALRSYVSEGLIISTCNRVEVYGLAPDAEAGVGAIRRFLADWHGTTPDALWPHLYTLTGADAVRHLFRLASGLESMVLGEDQIMGQIKTAFVAAATAEMLGQVLNRLLTSALAAGKRVRTQTAIARTPVSVVSVALESARALGGPLASQRVLILGTGRMAELALKHLRGDTARSVGVVGRSPERLGALAATYGALPWGFDQLDQALAEADVVISCTSAPGFVLGREAVARAVAGRAAPLLLLDMAVPRDIDPQVSALPGVRLIGVDDLQAICATNRQLRAVEVAHADTLVDDELARFMDWWKTQEVVPTIRALRERAEAIRADELAHTLAKFPGLSAREQHAISALSAAIINKLLHQPIAALKDPAGGDQLAPAVRQLFQLT